MRKSSLVRLCKDIGLRPSRKLGQNFLIDPNALRLISDIIQPQKEEIIVEIGAGIGNLSDLLLGQGAKLTAVEYDIRLIKFLEDKYREKTNVRLLNADAARLNYDEMTGQTPFKCVGNLPYSSSSVILTRILESVNKPSSMCFLIQREMAQRIMAFPGSKSYNSLSVRVQILYDIKKVRTFSPEVFWPSPEIHSTLITLNLKKRRPSPEQFKRLSALTKLSFSHRRKKLLSNLGVKYNEIDVKTSFDSLGIGLCARAESLGPDKFLCLLELLEKTPN